MNLLFIYVTIFYSVAWYLSYPCFISLEVAFSFLLVWGSILFTWWGWGVTRALLQRSTLLLPVWCHKELLVSFESSAKYLKELKLPWQRRERSSLWNKSSRSGRDLNPPRICLCHPESSVDNHLTKETISARHGHGTPFKLLLLALLLF